MGATIAMGPDVTTLPVRFLAPKGDGARNDSVRGPAVVSFVIGLRVLAAIMHLVLRRAHLRTARGDGSATPPALRGSE